MLMVLHLVLLASILLLPLVVPAETLLLAVPWILLLLDGVRFLGIGGSFLTMLFGLLFVFRLGLQGLVCVYVLPPFGMHPGLLYWMRLGVPGLLRLVVFGRSVMNTCSTFHGSSWMGSGLLWELETFLLPGEFGLLLLAGGPTFDRVFRCGRGAARFRSTVLGGPVVGKARADVADAEHGQFVHLFQDQFTTFESTRRFGKKSFM